MASTPEILSKLNVGSGMNNSDIITSLVDAERIPALERIEKLRKGEVVLEFYHENKRLKKYRRK